MHLPSSFLLAWTVIKDILKWVLQPSKPKQQTPLSAAASLKETNTSKPAFFVVSYFLFTFSSFSPFSVFLCWSGSELFAIWPFRECFKKSFACDLVYAPDTYTKKTFPSSHLNGGIGSSFLLPILSSSSLYFPPLLCVCEVNSTSKHQDPFLLSRMPWERCRGSITTVQSIAYASDKVIKTQHHVVSLLCLL